MQGNFEVRLEEKGQIGQGGKVIEAADPLGRAAAHDVPAKCGENVTVAQHEVASAQQWDQVPLVAIGKIGRVNQAESRGRKQFALFAFAGGGFDEFGGIPFAEIDFEPLKLEPAFQQVNLGGFAGTIETLDGNQTARKPQLGKCFHHEPVVRLNRLARNTNLFSV